MRPRLDIVFAGTPEFSLRPLEALLASEHKIIGVYTQPDRHAGRGRKLGISPVKELATDRGLQVFQPSNFREARNVEPLETLRADLMVVVAYGLILPPRVLAAPRLGCINVHASLLPRWRGAAPIQRAIQAGDRETGVTIMRMGEGLDDGPMLLKRYCKIADHDTGGSLHDRLSRLGAEALIAALPGIADGSLEAETQDERQSCYARKLTKDEGCIDWSRPAVELDRMVRAFNPWPVAFTSYKDKRLRIWEVSNLGSDSKALPGAVVTAAPQGIDVATAAGLLRIHRLQLPGKRVISAAEFLNGRDVEGVRFGA